MPACIISRVKISDPQTMTSYMAQAPASIETFGGKYLVRTQNIEVLEGKADYDRMVVLEFPDRERALAWYHSDEYRELRETRWRAAEAHIVVLPGEMI